VVDSMAVFKRSLAEEADVTATRFGIDAAISGV
jgi:hypothetical protein